MAKTPSSKTKRKADDDGNTGASSTACSFSKKVAHLTSTSSSSRRANDNEKGADDSSDEIEELSGDEDTQDPIFMINKYEQNKAKERVTNNKMSLTHPLISATRPKRATSSTEAAFFAHLQMQPSDDQRSWVEEHGNERSKELLEHKRQKLTDCDIMNFTNSFKHTHNYGQQYVKGGVMGQTAHTFMVPKNKTLEKFWGADSSRFCFIPILFGPRRTAHFVGVAIHLQQRKFYVYNSSKVRPPREATKRMKTVPEDEQMKPVPEDEQMKPVQEDFVYMDELKFHPTHIETQDGKEFLSGSFASSLQQMFGRAVELDKKCRKAEIRWRMKRINSFFRQESDVDCGAFVCFFFHAMALGLPVETTKIPSVGVLDAAHRRDLKNFREWIAFSICVKDIFGVDASV